MSIKLIAEIGINHNGDINIAKKLIDVASVADFGFVKLQKRNPNVCVPEHEKNLLKKVPWKDKEISYLQYKKDIEFEKEQYDELYEYIEKTKKNVKLFSSVWDLDSAKFMKQYTNVVKIPSAHLTNDELLYYCNDGFTERILSTGMSTEEEIEHAVKIFEPTVLMHTVSSYPCNISELKMLYITHLKEKYKNIQIGYSNHYFGVVPAVASIYLGAEWLEVHITINHNLWGSDQKASIEPDGLMKFSKHVRDLEQTLYGNEDRIIFDCEKNKRKSLKG